MYGDDELVPLSGLQHLLYCERQCALIHQERTWVDNRLTVEGTWLHRHADEEAEEARGNLLVVRGLPIRSARLGLSGKADVVEFRRTPDEAGTVLQGRAGRWAPAPVEYKRGRPKRHRADEVQLCAQALCLEEMFELAVPRGDLYYGKRKRRTRVAFDTDLRVLTEAAAGRLHNLLATSTPPPAEYEPWKCDSCSLISVCLPKADASTGEYIDSALTRDP